MKFSCERCGKKYATAAKPAPGKLYKLRCKACGHLIVVRAMGQVAPPQPEAAEVTGQDAVPAEAAPSPPVPIDVETAEPEAPANGALAAGGHVVSDTTPEIPEVTEGAVVDEAPPPRGDAGYVDLFSDLTGSGAAELGQKSEDPFLAAARASLPEGYGAAGGAPDPLAALREGGAEDAPRPPPKVPEIPRPPAQRSVVPLVLIGAGVVVLVGILAFVLLGWGTRPPALPGPQVKVQPARPAPPPASPVPAQQVAEAQPPADPVPAPAPAAAPATPPAEAQGGVRESRREARERRARDEREAKERRAREEREARERRADEEREARERRADEEREARRERLAAAAAAAEEAGGGLDQDRIDAVVRSTQKAFDGCLQSARAAGKKLDGREVRLRLNIQPSGSVTYPTLDDVTLNGTELGSCLKSAARLMVFPRFKGDTQHVEVPLVLR